LHLLPVMVLPAYLTPNDLYKPNDLLVLAPNELK
jgi:hypothetical protein